VDVSLERDNFSIGNLDITLSNAAGADILNVLIALIKAPLESLISTMVAKELNTVIGSKVSPLIKKIWDFINNNMNSSILYNNLYLFNKVITQKDNIIDLISIKNVINKISTLLNSPTTKNTIFLNSFIKYFLSTLPQNNQIIINSSTSLVLTNTDITVTFNPAIEIYVGDDMINQTYLHIESFSLRNIDRFRALTLDVESSKTLALFLNIDEINVGLSGEVVLLPGQWISKGKGIVKEQTSANVLIDDLELEVDIDMQLALDTLKSLNFNNIFELDINCILALFDALALNFNKFSIGKLTGPTFTGFNTDDASVSTIFNEIVSTGEALYSNAISLGVT